MKCKWCEEPAPRGERFCDDKCREEYGAWNSDLNRADKDDVPELTADGFALPWQT